MVDGLTPEIQMKPTVCAPRAEGVSTRALFEAAMRRGLPVALWRLPGQKRRQGVVGLTMTRAMGALDFSTDCTGFVFAPFQEGQPVLLVPDDVHFQNGAVRLATGLAAQVADAGRDFIMALAAPAGDTTTMPSSWHVADVAPDRLLGEEEFTSLVTEAVELIHATGVAKVVVSRTAAVPLPEDFAPAQLFERLCRRYPHAFVSLVSIPGAGTWIGATPELLMAVEPGIVATMALAGTQRRPENGAMERVTWGLKERLEQQMVSDYVRDFFVEAGVPDVQETGPRTVGAGGVVHLQTCFHVNVSHASQAGLANAVLSRLHPTSAVCGMPRREALAFITAREGYDRAYYSGYLGPVPAAGNANLYVNLRCMQLQRTRALVYVGAGITADSDPATEWLETELKSRTILDALNDLSAAPAAGAPTPEATALQAA